MACICGQDNCGIIFGLCHCGCGHKTPLAKKTDTKKRRVKGIPARYVLGHINRIRPTIEEAVLFKIDGVYCRVVPLSKGFWTIVDAADYKWVMQWKWFATVNKNRNAVYACRNSEQKDGVAYKVWLHREIMGLQRGDKREVDHENCSGIDNRRKNLRVATHMENRWNVGKFRNNVSGYKSVWWEERKQKWVAKIGVKGKYITLGYRDDPAEAYKLVCTAIGKHHEQFGRIA